MITSSLAICYCLSDFYLSEVLVGLNTAMVIDTARAPKNFKLNLAVE